MFEKARSLVRKDGLVLKKPGATEGSYITDGFASSFLVFLLRKAGLLLITERKSEKMPLWQQKNVVNSNNSWSCLGDQSVWHLQVR